MEKYYLAEKNKETECKLFVQIILDRLAGAAI